MSLPDIIICPGFTIELDIFLVEERGVGGEGVRHGDQVVADDAGHARADPQQARGPLAQQAGHYLVQGRVGDVVEAEVVATKSLQAQASVIC